MIKPWHFSESWSDFKYSFRDPMKRDHCLSKLFWKLSWLFVLRLVETKIQSFKGSGFALVFIYTLGSFKGSALSFY